MKTSCLLVESSWIPSIFSVFHPIKSSWFWVTSHKTTVSHGEVSIEHSAMVRHQVRMLRSSELKDLGSEAAAQVRQVEATEFGAPYHMYVLYIYILYLYTCAYCYYIIIVKMMIIIMKLAAITAKPCGLKERTVFEHDPHAQLRTSFRHVHISSIPFSKSMHGTPWVSGINFWAETPWISSNGFQVLETVARSRDKSLLHIHLDLDVLDPAEFPHVLPGETTIGPWVNK